MGKRHQRTYKFKDHPSFFLYERKTLLPLSGTTTAHMSEPSSLFLLGQRKVHFEPSHLRAIKLNPKRENESKKRKTLGPSLLLLFP